MDATNREIIDNFKPRLTTDYKAERYDMGEFEDQVPGYVGLLTRRGANRLLTNFNVPRYDDASVNINKPDKVDVEIVPYIDLDTLVAEPLSTLPNAPYTPQTAEELEDDYFATYALKFQLRLVNQPDPVPLPIPQGFRAPGLYLVRYNVRLGLTGNTNRSVAQLLVVDLTGAYDGPQVKPPAPELPVGMTGPLDRDYIANQPNETVYLPIEYDLAKGLAPGDTVEMYFGSSDQPYVFDLPPSTETRYRLDSAKPASIPLPLWVVQAEKKGNYNLRYAIFDVAENGSWESHALELADLAQDPLPQDFYAPLIELAVPGDGLIDIKDVADINGLMVSIPAYLNALRGTDEIEIELESSAGIITKTVPLGNNNLPLSIKFSVAEVEQLYGPRTPPRGRLVVTASYVVKRGTNSYPATKLSTPFDLDLSVVGPDITPPGTINTHLKPPVINAIRENGLFGPDNHLEVDDANKPARVLIELWTVPVLPQDSLPFTITLNYGGVLYPQKVDVLPPSGLVEFTIPFAAIRTAGGPVQVVSYTVTSPKSENPQYSQEAIVQVESVILQMAAPIVLNNNGVLTCDSLRPINTGGLVIHIPGSDYLAGGQLVEVTYMGFQNNTNPPSAVVNQTRLFTVPDDIAARNGFNVDFNVGPDLLYNPINANTSLKALGSATVTVSTQYLGTMVPSLPANYEVRGFRSATRSISYCAGGYMPV
ncbi:hypothetical protein [Pseudomonas poae]|uniref:Uncharacterized protein n=1 Tax=Pseudomonas poae TaxID=200451 RepID=A0AAP2S4Z6_9PSED|nr:hypothetical protein [Pseudomonas poae]MCF5657734.1 hypothetical protein [Pseudomonas poae]